MGYDEAATRNLMINLPVECKMAKNDEDGWRVHGLVIPVSRPLFLDVIGVVLNETGYLERCIVFLKDDVVHRRQIAVVFFRGLCVLSVPINECSLGLFIKEGEFEKSDFLLHRIRTLVHCRS